MNNYARPAVNIAPGDFIFYHPLQGDAVMQFDELLVFRGGRMTARRRPFAARI